MLLNAVTVHLHGFIGFVSDLGEIDYPPVQPYCYRWVLIFGTVAGDDDYDE